MQLSAWQARAMRRSTRSLACARRKLAPGPSNAWFAERAEAMRRDLVEHAMPFWLSCIDREHGGFRLGETLDQGPVPITEKHIVSQARLTWVFSRMARFAPEHTEYLEAARHGYRYLLERQREPEYGGYYWTTTPDGEPRKTAKLLYGQGFVIFALVEYAGISGDSAALDEAFALWELVQRQGHDDAYGGWTEHFSREFEPVAAGTPVLRGIAGLKSGDAHLHWMEALTSLAGATQRPDVVAGLKESIRINVERFFPAAGGVGEYRTPDWAPAGASEDLYGHQVEFAWLLTRAQAVAGELIDWEMFDRIMRRALRFAYDWREGGLYGRGRPGQYVFRGQKVWWVQAEFLAALSTWVRTKRGQAIGRRVLRQHLDFVEHYFIRGPERVWISRVNPRTGTIDPWRAESWKAGYHEIRGTLEFIEAFGGR